MEITRHVMQSMLDLHDNGKESDLAKARELMEQFRAKQRLTNLNQKHVNGCNQK